MSFNMITEQMIRELEEELHALHERLSNFVIETNRMRARVVEIENIITQSKITSPVSRPVLTYEMTNVDIPEESCIEDYQNTSDVVDTKANHTTIIPKPLDIEGFTDITDVIFYHLKELIPSTSYSTPYRWYDDKLNALAVALSLVGKELILIKNEERDSAKFEEWKKIIETCRKIATYHKKGDMIGYNKYLAFFCEKYPIPIRQFGDDALTFDFCLQNNSVYNDAFQLMYYIDAFKTTIESDYNSHSHDYWPNYPNHVIYDKIVINDTLVEFMEMIYMLRYEYNFTIAILPVLDENIIYRPKSAAQDGTYFSLFYYDDYVEEPTMEIEENGEIPASTYDSFGGSTYVKSHYRSGYWRNGRYVSGGYVKGHYRS